MFLSVTYNDSDDSIRCVGKDVIFLDVEIYNPSEDWMGYQVDYTCRKNNKQTRYGVGGIQIVGITPNVIHVNMMNFNTNETDFLFSWNSNDNRTYYPQFGDMGISAEFAYKLCEAIEEYYERE